MFIDASSKAGKLKHAAYLISAAIFGILINYFILVAIQVVLLQWILHSDKNVIWYSGYPPTLVFLYGFLLAGAVWGFILGSHWWRIIYVERRYSNYFRA